MRGRERNPAFFQQGGGGGAVGGGAQRNEGRRGENNIKTLLKNGRSTGSVILTEKRLAVIPSEIFSVEQDLEDGEKFWEIQPIVKLDLSNNEITDIPDSIASLNNLTAFKIRNNKVQTVSDALFVTCTSLVHVDLSSNLIPSLSNALGQLAFLSELLVNGNQLYYLPEAICDCTRLTVLEAADNQLESLPEAIGKLRHLIKLNVSNNKLISIPNSFSHLASLQDLSLKKNRLTDLPSLIGMTSLVVFEASDNKLSEFPSFPPAEKNKLARLYLGGNRLQRLPGESLVAGEAALVELDVQGNLLTEISADIGILKNLKLLNASNNSLSDIPYTLGYMAALQRIVLDGNPLRTIRRSLLTQSTADLKKYLRTRGAEPDYVKAQEAAFHFADISPFDERLREMNGGVLNCSGLKLETLPSDFVPKLMRTTSIDSMEISLRLMHLNLSGNSFMMIPGEIAEISTLQILDLSSNLLGQSHPADVIKYVRQFPASLRVLNVCKNALFTEHIDYLISVVSIGTEIPVDYHNHKHGSKQQPNVPSGLHSLLCSENRLQELPNTLIELSGCLRELQVSFNNLTSLLAINFRQFSRLEIFDASNNKLRALGNLHEAVNLSDVLLSNNDLADIPLEFGRLKKMRNFSLMGNPQKTVRLQVVQQGTEAILQVLRMRLPEDSLDQAPREQYQGIIPAEPRTVPSVRESQSDIRNHDQNYPPAPSVAAVRSHGAMGAVMSPPPPQQTQHHQRGASQSSRSGAIISSRDGSRAINEVTASTNRQTSGHLPASLSESISGIDDKIYDLERQFQDISARLDDPSMSEAKRFATKKDLAKMRANILRLNREKDSSSSTASRR